MVVFSMKKFVLVLSTLCLATVTSAAIKTVKVKINKSDIAKILETDKKAGTMMVKTHDGRLLRLRLNAAQISDIKKAHQKVASSGNKVALKAAVSASTSATAPAATTTVKVADVKEKKESPWGFVWVMPVSSGVEKRCS